MKLAMRDRSEAGGWPAIFAMIAAISLAQALQMSNGVNYPPALIPIGIAIVSLALGVLCSSRPDPGPWAHRCIFAIGGTTVALQLYQLATSTPGWYLHEASILDYLAILAVFGALTGPVIVQFPSYRRAYTAAWIVSFAALGIWIIRVSPNPHLDVFRWTHYALDTLSGGNNPYAVWMPNIDGEALINPDGSNRYGRPLSEDRNWVHTGYPYMPCSLLLSGSGYIFGDLRLTNLVFIVAGAVSMLLGRGTYAVLGAALFLTMPRIFLVLQQAWTDAYCVGLLAITACLAARSSRWTPWVFGLTLVSKQYMVFLAPLGLLLIPPPWNWKKVALFIGQTILSGTIVTLPWILWNPTAWFDALVPTTFPLRPSSLSFAIYMADTGKLPRYADNLPFLMMLPAYVVIALWSARGPAGFALSSALLLCLFVSFSKTSYGSQYFLVLGCALTAFALTRCKETDEHHSPSFSGSSSNAGVCK